MFSKKVKQLPTGVVVTSRIKNGKEVFEIKSPYPNSIKLIDLKHYC